LALAVLEAHKAVKEQTVVILYLAQLPLLVEVAVRIPMTLDFLEALAVGVAVAVRPPQVEQVQPGKVIMEVLAHLIHHISLLAGVVEPVQSEAMPEEVAAVRVERVQHHLLVAHL
jgi:hypothetical protein